MLLDDGQNGQKHVIRSVAFNFKRYILMVETKLNEVALKTEVNVRA